MPHRSRIAQRYTLATGGPPAMSWSSYARDLQAEWAGLLASNPAEKGIQEFLERHPSMVPGAFSALGRLSSGHGPFPHALISQPPLKALGGRTPDFVWLSRDSSFFNPVFIEIEDPAKPWVTRKGVPRAELTQALDQLRRWREWLDVPSNRQTFLDHFQVPLMFRKRKFQPIFVLIYGRHDTRSDEVNKLRASLTAHDQYVIPYDHLKPDPAAADFLCVKNARGTYQAVTFPATATMGPATASSWALVHGLPKAIKRNPQITPERKRFLIKRLDYWNEYARDDGGIFRPRDRE